MSKIRSITFKSAITLFIFMISGYNAMSQNSYEKGYYINDSGERTIGLIKNLDWRNNPKSIDFKSTEDASVQTINLNLMKEFGIDGKSKYLSATVKIDRSSNQTTSLSDNMNPEYTEEIVLLKVLIEGKAKLFQFRDKNLNRYFYQIDDSNIEPLVYKRYKTVNDQIGVNEKYKGQLRSALNCEGLSYEDIDNLRYSEKSLSKFFIDYNYCHNSEQINYPSLNKKDLFNLTLRPGLNMSSAKFQYEAPNWNEITFANKIGPRLGIEVEFILNYGNNKWAIIAEPNFQTYSDKTSLEYFNNGSSSMSSDSEISYTSIEVPIGVRYYSFINSQSKVFLNVLAVIDVTMGDSMFDLDTSSASKFYEYEIKSRTNYGVGLGYKYANKYSFEFRYQTARNLLDQVSWTSKYQTTSVIFGYTLF